MDNAKRVFHVFLRGSTVAVCEGVRGIRQIKPAFLEELGKAGYIPTAIVIDIQKSNGMSINHRTAQKIAEVLVGELTERDIWQTV